MEGTTLVDSSFIKCDFYKEHFSGADISGTYFSESKIWRAEFHRSNLTSVNFENCEMTACEFYNCDLRHAIFAPGQFKGAVLANAIVSNDRVLLPALLDARVIRDLEVSSDGAEPIVLKDHADLQAFLAHE